jgi:hypothetical protein
MSTGARHSSSGGEREARRTRRYDDRTVGSTGYSARDAGPESAPPGSHDDQLCLAITSELDDPPPRRPLEDLGFRFDLGNGCNPQSTIEHASGTLILHSQQPLIEGPAQEAGRSAAYIGEYEWYLKVGGEVDGLLDCGLARL